MRKRKLALIMATAMVFTACPSNGLICYADEIVEEEIQVEGVDEVEDGVSQEKYIETESAEEPAFYATGNETSCEDFNYTISDGEVMIKEYKGNDTSVVIPSEIEGYPVTQIGDFAFKDCSGLTSITIPNGVTSIGSSAFKDCIGLMRITIPDGVTSIGYSAFYGCIGLTSITIPGSVTEIRSWALMHCESITVDSSNSTFSSIDGVLFNKDKTKLICYPTGKKETAYSVPVSVTSIGMYAFQECSRLKEITIPSGITNIDTCAFSGCSSLLDITIPNTVTGIAGLTFSGCSSLTSITIPSSVTYIEYGAFSGCSSLESVILPNSVTSIGFAAFSDCSPKLIIFGYAGSFAEQYAKKNNITFKQIIDNTVMVTPDTLTIKEGESAALALTVTLDQYAAEAVWESTDSSIVFVSQEGIVTGKTVGTAEICVTVEDASARCMVTVLPSDKKQQILEGIKEYQKETEEAPFGLDVVLKEGDGELSYSSDNPAVAEITSDGTVTVKEAGTAVVTVTAAETEEYKEATFQVTLIVSEKVIDNPPIVKPPVNNDQNNLSQPEAAGAVITAREGVFKVTSAQKANPTVTLYSSADKNATVITVPTTIQKNGITYQVTAVEMNAFANLKKLRTVKIGANVTEIGANAFKGCIKLTKVTLPSSVQTIGTGAFSKCTSLKKIVIGKSVKKIGAKAFYGCKSLKTITIKSTKLKSVGKAVIKGIQKKAVIKVPKKQLKAYKKLFKKNTGYKSSMKIK